MRTVPLTEDTDVRDATDACLAASPDVVIATTGVGLNGWLDAAAHWGRQEQLMERLAGARLLARGPKARGALRAAGLPDAWTPPSETSAEILDRLLAEGVEGLRVAVQLHGDPLADFVTALRQAGATVIEIPVYRWELPEDVPAVRRLVERIVAAEVDAVTFTSAPAASGLLQVAAGIGRHDALVEAFRGAVLAACVGPVTAAPLDAYDVTTLQPQRARTKALVEALAAELPIRRAHT